MSKYASFVFKNYHFDPDTGLLDLVYGYDDALEFHETYKFNFKFQAYDEAILDRAIQLLFFLAGVSYYKLYLSPNIKVDKGKIDQQLGLFLNKTYQKGLGEFFYVNSLDPNSQISFPVNSPDFQALELSNLSGQLIGLGGGKDSLLSVEVLRDLQKVATWSLNHQTKLQPLVDQVGLNHFWVERTWDPLIMQLNQQDALNGHIPISAIFAATGVIVAILSGFREIIVSNESSASEPSLIYQGVAINHQYSKSLEFEKDFQTILTVLFGDSVAYYSLLRPFSELRIAEFFASFFDKYSPYFSSCNRAFTLHQDHLFWCGQCPKCAFVFLILTPFIERLKLEKLWHGHNLLLDDSLKPTYLKLLGIEGDKPLDCVGEVKEARTAMRLATNIYPELKQYHFDIPPDYDYKAWHEHAMPQAMYDLLKSRFGNL